VAYKKTDLIDVLRDRDTLSVRVLYRKKMLLQDNRRMTAPLQACHFGALLKVS